MDACKGDCPDYTLLVPSDDNPTIADKIGAAAVATPNPVNSFGNYEVLGELSRGGAGIIYRARQRGLERVVALKVLQGGSFAGTEQVRRFLNEAQAAARLQHPNIVPIHDFGTHEGQHFFTMDFIEGQSLPKLMERGALPAREALEIIRQTAEALHYAHEHGVIHRDVKPGNILLDRENRVKMTDFGIAKELNRDEMQLTVTGQVMGTPRYMSPEQASGKTAQADRRADVFSLGSTLYEMLTGQPAFDADNVLGVLQKVVTADPAPPHKVNGKVHRDAATICLKAMEKAPDNRYQTAQEMADDIARFLAGEPIEARPVGAVERSVRQLQRHWKVISINVAIVAFAIYAVLFYLNSRPSQLRVQISPAAVNAALDGQLLSDAEIANGLTIKSGAHQLRVELEPIYESQEINFDLKPAEQRTIPVSLQRRHGRLIVTTDPPDAAITIIGPDQYHAPFRGPRVDQLLPTGPYAVLVHRENFLAQRLELMVANRQTNTFHCALPPVTLWNVQTSGNVLSVPALADVDGDGWSDAMAGDDDGKIYCLSGKNGVALWVYRTRDAVQAPLSLADMNRDGVPDVVVGGTDGFIYCLNGKSGQLLWSAETRGAILSATLLHDVTGDGVPDAFVGSGDGTLYALNGADGRVLWKLPTKSRIESCLGWATEAGEDVLLLGNSEGKFYCVTPQTGQVRWETKADAPLLYPPRLEDIERNGTVTALLLTPQTAGDVRTFTPVRLDEHKASAPRADFPQWLDLAGDGKPKKLVVAPTGSSLYDADGKTLLWSRDYLVVGAYAADINRDGVRDLIFNNGPDQLLCLSGTDGAILGRIQLESAVGRGYAIEDVDADGVPDLVVGVGRQLACFSWVGGRKRWGVKGDSYYDTPAVAVGHQVLVKNQAGDLTCLEPAQGEIRWRVKTAAQPSPHAAVATDGKVVADADAKNRRLLVLQADTGKELWRVQLPGDPDTAIAAPAVAGNLVVIGGQAFQSDTGTLLWSVPLTKPTAVPAIGRDLVVAADGENTVVGADRLTGKERWRFSAPTKDAFPAAPLLCDITGDGVGDVIAVNDNGYTYALNGNNGHVVWQMEHSATRGLTRNGMVLAVTNGVLATGKGDVFCVNLKDGKPVWRVSLKESVLGAPAVCDLNSDGTPDVVVGTMARRLYCLDGRDGARLWQFEVGAQIRFNAPLPVTIPQEAVPVIVVGTGPPDNTLYCLRGDCRRAKSSEWTGPWRELTRAR